jgi:WD40 repeat protein
MVIQAHSSIINDLACNPGKQQFASCGSDGRIMLWTYSNDHFTKLLLDSIHGKVQALAFAPGGEFLAYGGTDGKLKLINLDVKTSVPVTVFSSPDAILSLACSETGNLLATGFSSGSIRIWSTGTLSEKPFVLIGRHSSGVTALTFSRNGNYLASSGYDKTVKIGSMQSREGKPISIEKHDLWVYDLTYAPDDKHLISCSADRTIRIFSTECSAMAQQLSKQVKRNLTAEEWNKFAGADIPCEKTRTDLP